MALCVRPRVLAGLLVLCGLVAIGPGAVTSSQHATIAPPPDAWSETRALLEVVASTCPETDDAAARNEHCLLLQHELDHRLAERHRTLAEAALSSQHFEEADRHFRLALTYAGFDPGLTDRIRRADPAAAAREVLDGSELYAQRLPSVVQVRTDGRLGSGVVVAPGIVLTNAHVLAADGRPGIVLTASGEEIPFTWSLKHPFADVGIVRVPALRAEPAPLGTGLELRPGEGVSLIGSPQGLAFSFSDGSVSAVGRKLDGGPTTMIQFTAPISQGSSGAPLFDRRGRVVGLASLFFNEGQALNFAVPIEYGVELMELAARL